MKLYLCLTDSFKLIRKQYKQANEEWIGWRGLDRIYRMYKMDRIDRMDRMDRMDIG